jgi:hypothetical protein
MAGIRPDVLKKWPAELTDKSWQKAKGLAGKAAGATGLGKVLDTAEKMHKAIDFSQLTPQAKSFDEIASATKASKDYYAKHVVPLHDYLLKTVQKTADDAATKLNKSALTKSAGKAATAISKAALNFATSLKSVDLDAEVKHCEEEIKKQLKMYIDPVPKIIGKIDLFLKDIDNFVKKVDKESLLALATGDGGARGYCTGLQHWDQLLKKNMPGLTDPIYKGSAKSDFFPAVQHYGANHNAAWWDDVLTKKGDEKAELRHHADHLKKEIPKIKAFQGYLEALLKAAK